MSTIEYPSPSIYYATCKSIIVKIGLYNIFVDTHLLHQIRHCTNKFTNNILVYLIKCRLFCFRLFTDSDWFGKSLGNTQFFDIYRSKNEQLYIRFSEYEKFFYQNSTYSVANIVLGCLLRANYFLRYLGTLI